MTVEHVPQPYRADLRDVATDSWTDVLVPVGDLARSIQGTDFVPATLRGSTGKIAAAILYGRELGLPPMTALSSVYVVHGRPGIYAETMRALALQAGHQIRIVESSTARCVVRGRRREDVGDEDAWAVSTYTMADAERATDARQNSNYKTRPADMLLARATARLCRMIFADAIHGMRSVEELEDMVDAPAAEAGSPPPAVTGGGSTVVARGVAGALPGPVGGGGSGGGEAADPPPPAVAPPARKRTTARTRGATPPPAAEQPAEAPPEPDDAGDAVEAQQAEIRELSEERRRLQAGDDAPAEQPPLVEPPADEPEPPADDEPTPMINPGQRAAMMARFTALGMKDRDERLGYMSELVGRELASGNLLTHAEAHKVLTVLEKARDADAFRAAVATISGAR